MTGFQLEGLHLLGYTKSQSAFLFLVATHSGYFTNGQFKMFVQNQSGSICHAFVRKLLDRKHARYHAYRSGGRVYHVFARKVYHAIERENLRTRKKHELEYVKARLVALDFVLSDPKRGYLETEAEKIAFFEKECGVSRAMLPVKQYRTRKSAEVTLRYFVDRFPIFVISSTSSRVVTFTYVDAGAVTLDAFGTHLRAYRGLLEVLPHFEFIYISPSSRLFKAAETEFYQMLYGGRKVLDPINILEYFRLRKSWDQKERVASADVVLLKEAQQLHSSKKIEELYEKWRIGVIPDNDVLQTTSPSTRPRKAIFRTLICGSSLRVFVDPRSGGAESWTEKAERQGASQISGESSAQGSES
jgi:hypothetical protein